MNILSKCLYGICFVTCFAALLSSGSAYANSDADSTAASELSPGAKKAAACATCHGTDGIAVLDLAPNLAGQKAMYTTIQLKAYRSGKRQHEVMGIIAKPLSDEDIDLLSEFYAGLAVTPAKDEATAENSDGKCEPAS